MLKNMACTVCQVGGEPLDREQINQLISEIPAWSLISENGEDKLTRTFSFKDFRSALAFSQRVGDLAEAHDHHPTIVTEWGKATVIWWTHKINGLHQNDFIMAAKTDQMYAHNFPEGDKPSNIPE